MRAADSVQLVKDAFKGWSSDQASQSAAALAFYTLFAIAPLLIIVIEIAAEILGGGAGHHNAVRDEILAQLRPAIGDAGTKAVADLIEATFNQRSNGVVASIVGWVVFAVAATGLIVAIQNALNSIWHIKAKAGIVGQLIDRARAFIIIGTGAVLTVAMAFATAAISAFARGTTEKVVNALLVLLVATLITAAIYKWLPKVELSWRDVWFGAIVSSVLSAVGQYLIGLYLGRAATTSAYGAAGSLVAVLLWLYYSWQLFLFGAELTKAYTDRFGSHTPGSTPAERGTVEPKPSSLPV